MKKVRKMLTVSFIGVLLFFSVSIVSASSTNYGSSVEHLQLYYDGYVQCKPSYNDGGSHAAQCWLRYVKADGGNDTGKLYSLQGTSQSDGRVLSVSRRYWDDLNPFAAKTTFSYGFIWVPHNAGYWPW